MTQIENSVITQKSKSFLRNKKQVPRIDMTPMVDLGFLLVTFFVFTTTMSMPVAADLFIPKQDSDALQPLPKSLALTVLLQENNRIWYYHGDIRDAIQANEIFKTDYSAFKGLGQVIRQKQKNIDESGKFKEGRKELMIIIKPTPASVYQNVIDVLDEIMINDVKKYVIVEPKEEEIRLINGRSGQ